MWASASSVKRTFMHWLFLEAATSASLRASSCHRGAPGEFAALPQSARQQMIATLFARYVSKDHVGRSILFLFWEIPQLFDRLFEQFAHIQ